MLSAGTITCLVATIGIPLAAGQRPERPSLRWNPELAPLVRFIEGERGLRFRQAVALRLVPADRFDRVATKAALPALSPSTVRALARVGVAAAPGGASTTHRPTRDATRFDLAMNTIDVRQGAAADERRVRLVDALTDALHHQTFDLSHPPSPGTERGAAWQALLIGDRTRITDAYRRIDGDRAPDRTRETQPNNAFALVSTANERFFREWMEA